jgi:hypothetical protein
MSSLGGIQENEERIIRFLLATFGQMHEPELAAEPHHEVFVCRFAQPFSLVSAPSGRSQTMPLTSLPGMVWPCRNRCRWKTMCARRSRISLRKESSVFTLLTHALPIKPADFVILAIGIAVPALVSAEPRRHRAAWEPAATGAALPDCWLRSSTILGWSVGPSALQFQLLIPPVVVVLPILARRRSGGAPFGAGDDRPTEWRTSCLSETEARV